MRLPGGAGSGIVEKSYMERVMILRWLKGGKASAPKVETLHDFIHRLDMKEAERYLDGKWNSGELNQRDIYLWMSIASCSNLLSDQSIASSYGHVSKDVVTFEALAFCTGVLKGLVAPMPRMEDEGDPWNEREREADTDEGSFVQATLILQSIVQRKLEGELGDLFVNRSLSYTAPRSHPLNDFIVRLSSIPSGTTAPAGRYVAKRLDVAGVEAALPMVRVSVFLTAFMPTVEAVTRKMVAMAKEDG